MKKMFVFAISSILFSVNTFAASKIHVNDNSQVIQCGLTIKKSLSQASNDQELKTELDKVFKGYITLVVAGKALENTNDLAEEQRLLLEIAVSENYQAIQTSLSKIEKKKLDLVTSINEICGLFIIEQSN